MGWDRRCYVSKWYEGIHPGRFFLFYKENKVTEAAYRGGPSAMRTLCGLPALTRISEHRYEQLIEDLRCIDGPGLGEKAGSKVEHIDDLFSK